VKDGKGDLVADFQYILSRWRNYFSRLLNVLCFNEVPPTEIHTAEQLVPETSASEFDLAIEKLKSYKSRDIFQIPV